MFKRKCNFMPSKHYYKEWIIYLLICHQVKTIGMLWLLEQNVHFSHISPLPGSKPNREQNDARFNRLHTWVIDSKLPLLSSQRRQCLSVPSHITTSLARDRNTGPVSRNITKIHTLKNILTNQRTYIQPNFTNSSSMKLLRSKVYKLSCKHITK